VLGTIIFGIGLWLAVDKHSLIALLKLVESERIEVRPRGIQNPPYTNTNPAQLRVKVLPRKHPLRKPQVTAAFHHSNYNAIYTQPIEVCNSHIELIVNQPRNVDQPHVQVFPNNRGHWNYDY